ncbi:hypothetical protein GCM10027028_10940 [Streptomyces sundarbansensis]
MAPASSDAGAALCPETVVGSTGPQTAVDGVGPERTLGGLAPERALGGLAPETTVGGLDNDGNCAVRVMVRRAHSLLPPRPCRPEPADTSGPLPWHQPGM